MKFELNAKGIDINKRIRRYVEDRIKTTLSKFGDRVRRVQVNITDVNGPKGGEDILCRIRADLDFGSPLAISELRADLVEAVDLASKRAGYRIGRRIQRLHRTRRS